LNNFTETTVTFSTVSVLPSRGPKRSQNSPIEGETKIKGAGGVSGVPLFFIILPHEWGAERVEPGVILRK
jgi:hypothetical protein